MVLFFGFIPSAGSSKMDNLKVKAVKAWPVLESWKQLQRFLGFVNQRVIKYIALQQPLSINSHLPISLSSSHLLLKKPSLV